MQNNLLTEATQMMPSFPAQDTPSGIRISQQLSPVNYRTFYHVHLLCFNLDKAAFKLAIDLASRGSQLCGYRPGTDELIIRYLNYAGCEDYVGKITSYLKESQVFYMLTKDSKCDKCWAEASRYPMYEHLCDHP